MADTFSVDPGPDPRAVAFLEAKGIKRSYRWPSMWGTEHAFAFTLAGVHRMDVLSATHQLTTEAVRNGQTLEGFKAGFEERLRALGFAGPQVVTEFPEGPRKVNLSAPARVRVIYDTNVRQAYAASEWQAIEDTAADFPALQYHHLDGQEHPRLQHQALQGLILRVSDPLWKFIFPPNGYFCHCWTMQISIDRISSGRVKLTTEAELAKRGLSRDPAKWPVWRHDATGREEPVPPGVNPGFGHNSGQARRENLADLVARKLEGMDPDLARAAAADLANFPQFADLVTDANKIGLDRARTRAEETARQVAAGASRAEAINAANARATAEHPWPADAWPVGVAPPGVGPEGGRVTVVNPQGVGHSADVHPTTPGDWGQVQVMLERGEVWTGADGDLVIFARFPDAAGELRWWTLVVKPVDGALRVKTLFPSSARRKARMTQDRRLVRAGSEG